MTKGRSTHESSLKKQTAIKVSADNRQRAQKATPVPCQHGIASGESPRGGPGARITAEAHVRAWKARTYLRGAENSVSVLKMELGPSRLPGQSLIRK